MKNKNKRSNNCKNIYKILDNTLKEKHKLLKKIYYKNLKMQLFIKIDYFSAIKITNICFKRIFL